MDFTVNTFLRKTSLLSLALPALLLMGCGGAKNNFGIAGSGSTGPGSGKSTLTLEDMQWGRLVDVFDSTGLLVESNVLIRESVQSDGVIYELSLNPITQRETLTIALEEGTAQFNSAYTAATNGLASLQSKGFDAPPPFTKVARNGCIQLVFSEYLDPATVDRQTIQVLVGTSAETLQSLELRYIVKEGIGQDGQPKGLVILDPTISRLESETYSIPENGVGFPASVGQVNPNVKIRIPTARNPFLNQNMLLTNKSGTQTFDVVRDSNGTSILEPHEFAGFDPVSVRSFRTGNNYDVFNGFLIDNLRPDLIVTQGVTISSVTEAGYLRTLTYAIDAVGCRPITPKVGDVHEVGDALVQINSVVSAVDDSAYVVTGTLLSGTLSAGASALSGFLTTKYTVADAPVQFCFVTITPSPASFPATEVDPFATFSVRFSEPIDVGTVRSLDSMVLASTDNTNVEILDDEWNQVGGEMVADYIDRLPGFSPGAGSGAIMFGPVSASGDAQGFTMAPVAGVSDPFGFGAAQQISLALRDGSSGILDLSGNPMNFSGFVAGHSTQTEGQLTLDTSGAGVPADNYFALRGNGADEDNDQAPEYAGQLGPQLGDGVLRGRSLTRFSCQADQTNQYVGQRLKFTSGIMTPLVPSGAVMMTVWAYHHLGFGLTSNSEFNLDVEGLNWSPFEGVLFDDTFARYSVALAHSRRFPDDYINPMTGYPDHKNSGLRRLTSNNFDENIYGYGQNPNTYADLDEVVCFDSSYSISTINRFQTSGGVWMYPWPDFTSTYTWRDTSYPKPNGGSLEGGNPLDGWGVPPRTISGAPPTYNKGYYPSIALPLLMRYRCYPRGGEWGFNGFQVQIMVGSSNIPAFRVFSAGGQDTAPTWQLVSPDLPPKGTNPYGGYVTSGPTQGSVTKGFGPELYWGQVDFVTKVSKIYTHWFDFGGDLQSLSSVTLEPTSTQANPGTSVLVDYRATTLVQDSGCTNLASPLDDASSGFDAYGDYDNTACGNVDQPTDWSDDAADLVASGKRFFQLRFTFVANIDQDLEAELDAFGFAYTTN
jgi:hypothetical protein